ncbi:MAG: phosphatase PAP2 family protein [Aurantibacter sp.]
MKNLFLITFLLAAHFAQGQEVDSPQEIMIETTVEKIGDYAQFAPAATSLAMLVIKNDGEGFWQFAESMGANLTATWTIKYLIDKPRPEGRTDGHAFPSGHTSAAFQGASFLQRRYGWSYGIPAYAIAGFVAYSRLEGVNTRHDGWDVVAGIIVGVGSTYLFTTPYQREHFELAFNGEGDNLSIGLRYKF